MEFGADRVVLATGATWRRSGVGRSHIAPIPGHEGPTRALRRRRDGRRAAVGWTRGRLRRRRVTTSAPWWTSALASAGAEVTIVTPIPAVAGWSYNTDEQILTQMRLMREGVKIEIANGPGRRSARRAPRSAVSSPISRAGDSSRTNVVLVTSREPNDALYRRAQRAGRYRPDRRLQRSGDHRGRRHGRAPLRALDGCARARRPLPARRPGDRLGARISRPCRTARARTDP